jgi:hypothetical protein
VKLEKDEFDSTVQVKYLTMQMILKSMGVKLEKDEFDSAAQVQNPTIYMRIIFTSLPFKLKKNEFDSAVQVKKSLHANDPPLHTLQARESCQLSSPEKDSTLQMILKSIPFKLKRDELDSAAQVENSTMQMILKSRGVKLEKDEFRSAVQVKKSHPADDPQVHGGEIGEGGV